MSIPISRSGDPTDHGGVVIAITTHTYVNGKLVNTIGAIHVCPEHGPNPMVTSSPDVYREGMLVCRIGDSSACGGKIIAASPDTFAN